MYGEIAIILVTLLAAYCLGVFRGAPFVPTDKSTLEKMISAAGIRPGIKIADLGSGDGRIVIAAAQAGAVAHGYEINPVLVWWSRYKIKKAGLEGSAFIHWKSFWNANLQEFDVVMLFGITSIMNRLGQKLQRELKPRAKVISNIFKFTNWEHEKVDSVYIYRV